MLFPSHDRVEEPKCIFDINSLTKKQQKLLDPSELKIIAPENGVYFRERGDWAYFSYDEQEEVLWKSSYELFCDRMERFIPELEDLAFGEYIDITISLDISL